MSYVGKILVIVQVVMSLLFMAFAGAVFTMHSNWRAKYTTSQQQLATAEKQARDAQNELATAKTKNQADLETQTQEKNNALAQNATLISQVADLQSRNNALEKERDAQSGVSVAKADEAAFRKAETERLRVANQQLQVSLEQQAVEIRKRTDDQFALENRFQALNRIHEASLKQTAFLKEVVAKANLETDPEKDAEKRRPAPPVDGIVTKVHSDRTNRVSRVSISIGSDDGLKIGDTLSAYRAVGQQSADWLGTIKVVSLTPDTAIANVVLTAKSGIIQELDNVTTKF